MTRWDRLLSALGTTPEAFERESSAFDLNPKSWVEARVSAQLAANEMQIEIPDKELEEWAREAAAEGDISVPCNRQCCKEA